ncbi:MAG TPA: NAD(P)-dependent oxidoreductase [Gemmatimonadales bacterium]|jgi:GDP-4-dehydro-6-deoxy-D-mannose reductase
MKVLVTGANGFVGRAAVARLAADGHTVVAAHGPGANGGMSLDVTSDASVRGAFGAPVDAVIHLAAVASTKDARERPALAWAVNAEGTARVARLLAEAAARWRTAPRLLVVSSAEVYAPSTTPHREDDAVGPTAPYNASKLGGELAALHTFRSQGLSVVVARPFPHIGPGQDPRYWVAGKCRILRDAKRHGWPVVPVGDLTAVRDFLHVADVVDAYVRLLERGAPGEVYNVASGQAVSLEEVQTCVERLLEFHPKREHDASHARPDARPVLVGDATRLRAATGWSPRHSLEDTLREVLDAQTD